MNIVIIGSGKFGYVLTEQLSRENHNVTIIDKNGDLLSKLQNLFDVRTVCGNGACRDVQIEAETSQADIMIAATSSDELNILCCLVAKKLGAKHTIARVRSPEYSEQLGWMKDDLGLSMVINPEFSAARAISSIIRFPGTIKKEYFAKGKVELCEFKIGPTSKLRNKSLIELNKQIKQQFLICAVERKKEIIIPQGNFVLNDGDKIYVTSSVDGMAAFLRKFEILTQKIRSVIIIGGSRIAYYLSVMLIKLGIRVQIIELDKTRCIELKSVLKNSVEIINGDGAEQEVLREARFQNADAIVALTDIDEENMIIAMYAQKHGIRNLITKINRRSFHEILQNLGMDNIIAPKVIASAEVVGYVRAIANSSRGTMETLYKLVDGRVEGVEFIVPDKCDFIGVPIKELGIRKGVLLSSIVRKGHVIVPSGENVLEADDSILVITSGIHVNSFYDIFE